MRANRRHLLLAASLAMLCAGCSFSHDTDKERFSCKTDADCGAGFSCITQKATGNGICFPQGQCKPETCNGLDDDCDGVVDDIPEVGQPCTSSAKGACTPGLVTCTAQGQGCAPIASPMAEVCSSDLDLNCDGLAGCADPTCDNQPCADAGCTCVSGFKTETDCGNGVDDDGDGATDCADTDCNGQSCGAGCVCNGPVKTETNCGDGLDNDGDSLVDCSDLDCDGQSCGAGCVCARGQKHETDCGDGVDNDGDGLIDCADPDCLGLACAGGVCGTAGPAVSADGGLVDSGSAIDAGSDAGFIDLDGGSDGGSLDGGSDGGFIDLDGGAPVDAGPIDAGLPAIDAGPLDAGSPGIDAGPPQDAGFLGYCALPETACADGLDNDGDGRIDCLDPDCTGLACSDGGLCLGDGGCQ